MGNTYLLTKQQGTNLIAEGDDFLRLNEFYFLIQKFQVCFIHQLRKTPQSCCAG